MGSASSVLTKVSKGNTSVPGQCVELPAGRPVLPGILISVLAAGNQPVAAVIPRCRNLINSGGRQGLGETQLAAT